jgi:hypothetical protein
MRDISSFVLAPVMAASVLPVWRRSWLSRRRDNHDYADVRVMPMCSRWSWSSGVGVLERSA